MSSLQQRLYERAPASLQTALITAYAAARSRKRFGGNFGELLTRARSARALNEGDRKRIQLERLQIILRDAATHVPYYRDCFRRIGLRPADVTALEDLDRIPVLTKAAARAHATELLSDVERIFWTNETSGSTGTPLTIHLSASAYRLTMALLVLHEEDNCIRTTDRRATFAGRLVQPVADDHPPFWRYNWAEHQMLCSAYHLSEQHVPLYVDALERFRPVEIIGYPSAIAALAGHCRQAGLRPRLPLRAIITNSETLFEWQRSLIEEVFGAPVRDYYGTAEAVVFAPQCSERRYHPDPLMGISEVLDERGRQVPPGTAGRLVCTTLSNTTMPLIRYEIGDSVIPSAGTCSCGRPGPTWESVLGRLDDVVVTPEGHVVGRLDHVFKGVAAMKEAQIAHTAPDRVVIRVVPDAGYSPAVARVLIQNARERLGDRMRVDVEEVSHITRSSRGKFRGVVREY